jgi:hypothetical protein
VNSGKQTWPKYRGIYLKSWKTYKYKTKTNYVGQLKINKILKNKIKNNK